MPCFPPSHSFLLSKDTAALLSRFPYVEGELRAVAKAIAAENVRLGLSPLNTTSYVFGRIVEMVQAEHGSTSGAPSLYYWLVTRPNSLSLSRVACHSQIFELLMHIAGDVGLDVA